MLTVCVYCHIVGVKLRSVRNPSIDVYLWVAHEKEYRCPKHKLAVKSNSCDSMHNEHHYFIK